MTEQKQRVLSFVQSSGTPTLGNYLGAFRNWRGMAAENDCIFGVADLHALTVRNTPADLRRRSVELYAWLLALGLDPEKNVIFMQSHVPAHAQLAWVLNCYTAFGEASRMTQFKDKSKQHADNVNVGLFTYPILMAADILLYQADKVPVGDDQKQHLELARDIAVRFNGLYGDVFKVPEPYIGKKGSRITSLTDPEKKMSKSDPNERSFVLLTDDNDRIAKKIKSAVTDSEALVRYDPANKPGVANLMTIYSCCTGKDFDAIEQEFAGHGYGDFKAAVAEAAIAEIEPLRAEYQRIVSDKATLEQCAKNGAEKAAALAFKTLRKVMKKVGFWQV
ncbi:MAG: tryptophan--tRNA ligase [Clostridia bacterium]|nr:tryptophan--tRNA ligase [Clostridia bacterium]MBR5768247.1 tryptophan--tRNA ligase [Clostridia bacterium]